MLRPRIYFGAFSTKSSIIYLPKKFEIYVENIGICHPSVINYTENQYESLVKSDGHPYVTSSKIFRNFL